MMTSTMSDIAHANFGFLSFFIFGIVIQVVSPNTTNGPKYRFMFITIMEIGIDNIHKMIEKMILFLSINLTCLFECCNNCLHISSRSICI